MFDWRRGGGSICHGYMCIVLYMKLIWINVRMTQRFGVVVFHGCMVNWWGGKRKGDSGSKLEGDSGSKLCQ